MATSGPPAGTEAKSAPSQIVCSASLPVQKAVLHSTVDITTLIVRRSALLLSVLGVASATQSAFSADSTLAWAHSLRVDSVVIEHFYRQGLHTCCHILFVERPVATLPVNMPPQRRSPKHLPSGRLAAPSRLLPRQRCNCNGHQHSSWWLRHRHDYSAGGGAAGTTASAAGAGACWLIQDLGLDAWCAK